MAQFSTFEPSSNSLSTVQVNNVALPQEPIINFIGVDFTGADDAGNTRTNISLPAMVHIAGSTMTGALILNADPVTALGAATKQYVDSLSAGLSPRTSCKVATTTALTVSYNNGTSGVGATLTNAGAQAALSIDGVSLSVNDRVLVKDQAAQAQNGIYVVTTVGSGASNWVMTRATDFDQAANNEVVEGAYTVISEGTTNAANLFVETGQGPFTIGTTAIVFSAFNSAANINVTAPLSKSGNTISLTTPLSGTYGGTGVNNGANTITLGGAINTAGAFSTSGAFAMTLTATGATNVTLPTSGTLVNTAVTTLSSLASIGTITSGVWNGTLIGSTYGGTGINNGSSTLTMGGSVTFSGAFTTALTVTGNTTVTLPTSGTLATTAQIPSLPISLTNGGTNASLVASNGGIFYSTGTAGAILSGTATAGQILRSGSSAAPSWSTATYPATTTVNQILYSSSANVIGGITTGNNGVLITSAGGVPSISSTLPSAVQGNITTLGTISSGTWNGTAIGPTFGGTGLASYAQGDILYASALNTLAALAKNTTATRYLSNTGTSNNPAWAQVDLTNGVTGTLPIANGGTGQTNIDVLLQRVSTQTGTVASGTTTIPADNTIPQNTEGDQYMTLAITPKSSTSKLVIEVVWNGTHSAGQNVVVALFQDTTANALAVGATAVSASGLLMSASFRHIMTSGTTSSTTFKIRAGNSAAGTTTFNGASAGTAFYGGTIASSINIYEYVS